MSAKSVEEVDVEALIHVARILHDQLKVYPLAVDIAEDGIPTSAIQDAITQRHSMLEQVEPCIRNLGGTPPDNGTPTGLYHQIVTAIHGVIDEGSRTALGEVRKGEDDLHKTVTAYSEDTELSEPTRKIFLSLSHQLIPIRKTVTDLHEQLVS